MLERLRGYIALVEFVRTQTEGAPTPAELRPWNCENRERAEEGAHSWRTMFRLTTFGRLSSWRVPLERFVDDVDQLIADLEFSAHAIVGYKRQRPARSNKLCGSAHGRRAGQRLHQGRPSLRSSQSGSSATRVSPVRLGAQPGPTSVTHERQETYGGSRPADMPA